MNVAEHIAATKCTYKSLRGRRVRLLTKIVTCGGAKFPAGAVMVIESWWRGRASLRRWGSARWVMQVHPKRFELYTNPKERE